MAKVLVLYYSAYGHIETMANAVADGAREAVVRQSRVGQRTASFFQRLLCAFKFTRRDEALSRRQASAFIARVALSLERTLKRRHSLAVALVAQ